MGYITPDDVANYATAGGILSMISSVDMDELEKRRVLGQVSVLDVRGKADFDH